MAPPGRRRNVPHLLLFCALSFLLFLQSANAASAVLGLDIGTEYIKAALVKPGVPLDIVLTKDSKRKEAAAIGFKPVASNSQDAVQLPERLYGADALAVAPRFSSDVYPNLKPLLGTFSDNAAAVLGYQNRYPGLDLSPAQDKTYMYFNSAEKTQDPFTVEELLAMEIASIKQNAETMAGKGFAVRHAVITVPSFYTVDERRAIELAAELAGLEVMSLISDGLAVGLNYATSRKFPNVDQGEKPEHHLVYDMGAGSTTATVLKFQARTVKDVGRFNKTIQEVNVIGTGWDRTLGGDQLNEMIVEDMAAKFAASSEAKKQDVQVKSVLTHGRTMAKLWREAERLRQVLSANTATSANLESLYNDIDFKYKLSREDFQKLAKDFIGLVRTPITNALTSANLELSDIDSIVLHGGLVRTPFVQKELEALVRDPAKLRTNVNADEAAVFGAAFKAAGLSPNFKVKDIKSNDAANYPALMTWTANGRTRSQKIFVPTSQAGTVKQMPFNVSEDFVISISQEAPSAASDDPEERVQRKVSDVRVANLSSSIAELVSKHGCSKDGIKTLISARLDPIIGIPEIHAGSVSCEVNATEKKGGVVDGVKGLFGFGGKKEQEPLGDTGEAEELTETVSVSESSSTDTSSSSSGSSASSSAQSTPSKPPEKKTETINLAIESKRADLRQVTTEQLEKMHERLGLFDRSDNLRRLREEAFNTLESYTYRARDFLTDDGFIGVSTKDQRKAIEDLISSTSDWIHEEGASAVTDTILQKHKALINLIRPIQKRKTELQKRPAAFESMQSTLNQTEMFVKSVREQIDKAADAAASASSSAADASSSTPEPSPSSDALEDLDDEPSSSTSASPTPSALVSPFSEDDYEKLLSAYEEARDWFHEQMTAQKALSPSDEPVVSSSEINEKSQELNEALSKMLMKQIKMPPKGKASSSKGKSKGKSKTRTKSSGAASSSSPSGKGSQGETTASHGEL